MVSDIYFPIPPSPYPAFYPISYPISNYQSRPLSSPQPIQPYNPQTKPNHMYDANRNHVVPYYYSETLTHCMPNNIYGVPNKNRHTVAINPYDERQIYYQKKLKSKADLNTSQSVVPKAFHTQSFRPYSVMEPCKSPISVIQRPSSVVPTSEQYKLASFFTDNDIGKTNVVPEWKARLQKEFPKPFLKQLEKPLRPVCKIPNCKCSIKLDPLRYSEIRTLPTVTERSLNKIRNLSLPTLKLEELDKIEKSESEAERDVQPIIKPVSEQHLGYV